MRFTCPVGTDATVYLNEQSCADFYLLTDTRPKVSTIVRSREFSRAFECVLSLAALAVNVNTEIDRDETSIMTMDEE